MMLDRGMYKDFFPHRGMYKVYFILIFPQQRSVLTADQENPADPCINEPIEVG